MWFKQTMKSSQKWLFPWGKGREEGIKQPKTAIKMNCSPSPFFSHIPSLPWGCMRVAIQPRWFGDRRYSLWCVVNETFRHIAFIQKDAAVCTYLFNFPSDAGGTDSKPSQCLYAEKPFDTTTGRFIVPLPLVLALNDGAVSDLGQAPAAVSVDLMKGFVCPLTLIPIEDLNCYCY